MHKAFQKEIVPLAALVLLSSLLLGVQLGKMGLMDPDEPFYALTAKEMLEHQDLWTPRMFGEPQFEKPIFFYWVLYASFALFGIHEWSARLGPCLAGILTVVLVYFWGRILFKRIAPAFLSAMILATAGQFIVLSRIVLTDIFLCFFVTGAWTMFSWGLRDKKKRAMAWNLFFVFLGLGFLTKGPVGVLIPFLGIAAYTFFAEEKRVFAEFPWISGTVIFLGIAAPWYLTMTRIYGAGFLKNFFVHENIRRFFVAEHEGANRWFFYPLVLWLGFFPWSGTVIVSLIDAFRKRKTLFLSSCFWTTFIFFTCAKSKLMSYLFPIYPVTALLCGTWVYKLSRAWRTGFKTKLFFNALQGITWGLFPLVLAGFGYVYAAKNELPILKQIFWTSAMWVPLSWMALYFFYIKKINKALTCIVCSILIFSNMVFSFMMPAAGKAFSTQGWSQTLKKLLRDIPQETFFSSKMFVRGVAYYTDHENVGVWSSKAGENFYTPHPIPILSDVEKFIDTYRKKMPVFFLIREKEYKHLKSGLPPEYSISILEKGSQKLLVRLDRV